MQDSIRLPASAQVASILMTTVNPHYTISYSQPEEYHFSHDSVFLARRVFEITGQQNFHRVLDLCAGCGVVGIDFLHHLQAGGQPLPEKIDFLEVQSIYQKHFAVNIAQIPDLNQFEFLTINYDHDTGRRYDLILCNPPYFEVDRGALSPSEFKNRCRFFIDSNYEELLSAIERSLEPGGHAFVLLKNFHPTRHALKCTRLEKIRSTDLYQIQRT